MSKRRRPHPHRKFGTGHITMATILLVAAATTAAPSLVVAVERVAFRAATCDVTAPPFNAVGNGRHDDTGAIRGALKACGEVTLPADRVFLTGPLNLTSHQRLVVDGTLLASTDPAAYPQVAPLVGYGWSIDSNCFPDLIPEIVP